VAGALGATRASVVGVSPIVGGAAVSGPAKRCRSSVAPGGQRVTMGPRPAPPTLG